MGVSGRQFRNPALLATSTTWLPSGLLLLLRRAGTDCFDLRDWSAMSWRRTNRNREGRVVRTANCKLRFACMAVLGVDKTIRRCTETLAHARRPVRTARINPVSPRFCPARQFAHQILASEPNTVIQIAGNNRLIPRDLFLTLPSTSRRRGPAPSMPALAGGQDALSHARGKLPHDPDVIL